MTRVAVSMKLRFNIFDTKGNEREARRLHSMTFTVRSLARYWMLNGPEMLSSRAICREIFLIWRMVE